MALFQVALFFQFLELEFRQLRKCAIWELVEIGLEHIRVFRVFHAFPETELHLLFHRHLAILCRRGFRLFRRNARAQAF